MLRLEGVSADAWADPFDPRYWRAPEPRPDDVCQLHLSDRIDCYALLDRQDYEWAKAFGSGLWCHTYGSGSYTQDGTIERPDHIYARKTVKQQTLWLHRLICLRANGEPPSPLFIIADHKNGNTLDNRRCNLQWATRAMNARNVKGSAERARLIAEQAAVQRVAIG